VAATRRLAAIMFTDVVDFASLTQANEAEALRSLKEQEDLVRPILASHRGRDVKSTGDGFLVEFDSALHAVQCAIDIHDKIRERNARPGVSPIRLRIGVHLGDVEERSGDIFGDAVNIAARIEPLAPPGGICISGQVFDQVRNKMPNRFDKLPRTELKHVHQPIDIYRVSLPWEVAVAPAASAHRTRLAVLPLSNISPDANDEYFADGLTEELISRLSKLKELRVIARTSVAQYRSTSKSVAQIASELDVGSVLEGSVRKAGSRLRITLQLIDTATQEHIWANTFDRTLDDVFAIQSEIAEQTARVLRLELVGPERKTTRDGPTTNLEAYKLYLKGLHASHQLTQSAVALSFACFEEAIRLDPQFSRAYSAFANAKIYLAGATLAPSETFPAARDLIARALELDPDSPDAHAARGNLALQYERDWKLAESELRRAIDLNPSYAEAHWWYSMLLKTIGRFDESLDELHSAIDLDPLWEVGYLALIQVHWARRDYPSAIAEAKRQAVLRPKDAVPHLWLAGLYTVSGDLETAQSEFALGKSAWSNLSQESAAALASASAVAGPEDSPRNTLPLYDTIPLIGAMVGDTEPARRRVAELEEESKTRYVSPVEIAAFHATLGDNERALVWLERDAAGDRMLWFSYQNPGFDPLRHDPRFRNLLQRMNLPSD
jgi:adenylate cyclase